MELHLELGTLKENAAAPRLLPCGKAIVPLTHSSSDHATTSPNILQHAPPPLVKDLADNRQASISRVYTAMPYEPIIDPTRPIEVDGMDTTRPAALNAAFTASIMPLSPIREQDIMQAFPNTWKPIGANKDEKDDSLDALAAGLHPLPATSQQLRDINSLPDRAIQLRKICDKYANADPIVRNTWHRALKAEEKAAHTLTKASQSVLKLVQAANPCSIGPIGPCTRTQGLLAQGYYRPATSAGWRFPAGTPLMPRGLVPPNWSFAHHVAGLPQPPFPPSSTDPSDSDELDDVEDEASGSEPEDERTLHCPARRFMAKLQRHARASTYGKRPNDEGPAPCNKRPAS